MEVKLKIGTPKVRGFLHHAYQTAVLSDNRDADPWFYMNYIQLVSDGRLEFPVMFHLPDHSGYNWSFISPLFDYQVINRKFILDYEIDFEALVFRTIQEGNYIFTYVNEKYIPATRANLYKYDYKHMILLTGVNTESRYVYFLGFDHNDRFGEGKVHIEQLKTAYFENQYTFPRYEDCWYSFKVSEHPDSISVFNLSAIIEQLKNFAESKRAGNNIFDYRKAEPNQRYGFDVYPVVIEALEHMAKGEEEISFIPIHILLEHKQIMCERLLYIENQCKGIELSEYIQAYNQLTRTFQKMRNSALKFQHNRDFNIFNTIAKGIFDTIETEKNTLISLIDCLKHYQSKQK